MHDNVHKDIFLFQHPTMKKMLWDKWKSSLRKNAKDMHRSFKRYAHIFLNIRQILGKYPVHIFKGAKQR